jgi:hypothetical protein
LPTSRSAISDESEEGGVKPPLHEEDRENVGAPTFKVLLEGFSKEFVFKFIGGWPGAPFQFGNVVM